MEMLESYLKQIQRYPLLDAKQEIELSKLIEAGSKAAQEKLVQSNLRLVVSVAKRIGSSSKVSLMDLIQEGNMGLMTAASKYHYSFSTRFSTYAYTWILQYMLRYLYNKTSMIALPHRKEELLRKISIAQNSYVQTYGREATVDELSDLLAVSRDELSSVLSCSYTVTSIDIQTSDDGSSTIADLIPDTKYNPEERYLRQEKIGQVHDIVNSLPENEKKVICNRFNFAYEQHVPTLRELSSELGVSAETVRQMEMRAVRKIRELAATMRMEELITA